MSDKTHSSAPITRREVTSVLGNGRKPLASIAKAQALLKERAAAAADGYFVPTANVTPLNSNPLNARPQAGEFGSCPGTWCKKRQQKRSAGHRISGLAGAHVRLRPQAG